MNMSWILIIPWLVAAGLAHWKMETNYSVLKKDCPKLYDIVKDDKDGSKTKALKDDLDTYKKTTADTKKELEDYQKTNEDKLKDKAANKVEADKEKELQTAYDTAAKELNCVENIDKGYWPVFSVSNIAWVLGIFFGVGLILHFITKKALEIFNSEEK